MTADEYAELREVFDAIQEAKLGDVPPAELFAGISTYLRSSFARPVEMIEHAPLSVSSPPY
ncbi:BioD-like phosphotransacetylase family protein [Bradyrhizobium sp. i1.4.4]